MGLDTSGERTLMVMVNNSQLIYLINITKRGYPLNPTILTKANDYQLGDFVFKLSPDILADMIDGVNNNYHPEKHRYTIKNTFSCTLYENHNILAGIVVESNAMDTPDDKKRKLLGTLPIKAGNAEWYRI